MLKRLRMTEYSIRQLSAEFGVTSRTIRHYEELGLLAPSRRGQTRIYSPADRTRLKLILRGRRVGLSLEEAKDIINMYDPDHDNRDQLHKTIAAIRRRREQLLEQQRELELMLEQMDEVEQGCLDSLAQRQPKKRSTKRKPVEE